MPCGWEGNRGSGVALGHASQTSVVYPATGSRPRQGDEHPAYTLSCGVWPIYLTLLLDSVKNVLIGVVR